MIKNMFRIVFYFIFSVVLYSAVKVILRKFSEDKKDDSNAKGGEPKAIINE